MILVSEQTARTLVSIDDAIAAVEACFVALETGDGTVFPVVSEHGTSPRSSMVLKSGCLRTGDDVMLGVKLGTYWPDNVAAGLESHGSTVLLIDDATGMPRALVGASHLTALRTAAADAVAVKYLAAPDAETLGIVGAGHQARFELQAVARVRSIARVRIWARDAERAAAFAAEARVAGFADVAAASLEETVSTSRIVVAVTSAHEPLVQREWVAAGTHVSSMGSDIVGKQELDPQLVASSTLFADVVAQALTIGEFQHAAAAGSIDASRVRAIGEVAAGRAPGRTRSDEITVFDSSGVAAQDLAIAHVALRNATQHGSAVELTW